MIKVWNLEKAEWVDHKLPDGILDETIFAANAPDYMCLTGPRYTPNVQLRAGEKGEDDWMAKQLAREAKEIEIQERRRIIEDIKHLARIKRKEIKQREKAEMHAISKRRQAEKRARPSPEDAKATKSAAMVKAAATRAKNRKAAGGEVVTRATAGARRQAGRREARAIKRREREAVRVHAGLLTIAEVCAKYGRQKMAIWHACKRGAIEYKVEARALLMPIESVERYIAASKAWSDSKKQRKRG